MTLCIPLACGLDGFPDGYGSVLDPDSDSNPGPIGVLRKARVQLVSDGDGHAYGVGAVAAPDAFVVTWEQPRAHLGEAEPTLDVFARRVGPAAADASDIVGLTPYAGAQLQAVPLSSDVGFSVLWHDDAIAGFPDRRVLVQRLDAMPIEGPEHAIAASVAQTHQRAGTAALVGDRALVVYASANTQDAASHASLIDLTEAAIVRELDLPAARWDLPRTVTAGAGTFLVLHMEGNGRQVYALFATVYDVEGDVVWGPTLIGDRYPVSSGPIVAGYHAGWFFIPILRDREITVDRPCCPLCRVIQEPTCTIQEYDTYVVTLKEQPRWLGDPWCLDCRIDTGVAVPLMAGADDGVYFYWDGFLARATVSEPPRIETWRRVEFDDGHGLFSREIHAVDAFGGRVALAGRQRNLAEPDDHFAAFVAWVEY